MMKATGLKRGSRKKQHQQTDVDKDDPAQHSVIAVVKQIQSIQPKQQPPPPQPIQPMQHDNLPRSRRSTDEISALTTKNYRLAKELVSVTLSHAMLCFFKISTASYSSVSV
jgi:hypothetical protein